MSMGRLCELWFEEGYAFTPEGADLMQVVCMDCVRVTWHEGAKCLECGKEREV